MHCTDSHPETSIVTHRVRRRLWSRRLQVLAWLAAALASIPVAKATADVITYPDFSSTNGLVVNGNAAAVSSVDGSVIRLVPALSVQVGSFYTEQKLNVTAFSTLFEFRLTDPGGIADAAGQTGADGIVFVVQSVGNTALGETGGGQGYFGIASSVGVEFDTWTNSWDLDSNHVGIDINGDTIVGAAAVATRFDDGNKWFAWIDYDGSTLEVRTNQTGVRPLTPDLSAALDLPAIVGGDSAYVGFSAATFSAFENHDILSWNFVSVPEPNSLRLLAIGMLALVLRRNLKGLPSIYPLPEGGRKR